MNCSGFAACRFGLWQHRTISSAAVYSVFHARNALLKLEIHKVFLRFRAFF